ncbi:MAG TPA: glycosyltransferase family 4 protein [Stellaceae bacterium]|nr:glycosyltransferase family 4 protein [Stellaceae bacterium]
MDLAFIVPGAIDQRTGGYLFDRRIVEGLRAMGHGVNVHELSGRFPLVDATARRAAAAVLDDLADGSTAVIDGLALPAFAESLPPQASRLRPVGFVHHPLALETGLPLATRETLARTEARLLPRLRGVICPSRTTEWHLIELGVAPAAIAVTPPGTDRAPPRAQRPEGPPLLLTVGTVTPRKGHLLVIEALAPLADRAWQLICIGSLERSPETARTLTQAIRQHRLQQRVTLAGEWPHERIANAYAEADLFVLASYHEGYGMALAEALAHGLPIVATTAGAIPETVPADAALLVPPGDRDQLTRALAQMLDNASLRARLAAGAAAAGAALPDWPSATQRWLAALERLAGEA